MNERVLILAVVVIALSLSLTPCETAAMRAARGRLFKRGLERSAQRNLLLYKINEEKSIYIVDKMRRISIDEILAEKSSTFEPSWRDSNEKQEYSLLYSTNDYILVGGLNSLYNISLSDLNDASLNKKLNLSIDSSLVPSFSLAQYNECQQTKKSTAFYNPYKCGNYVRVAVPLLNNSLLVTCSTNRLNPICQIRATSRDDDENDDDDDDDDDNDHDENEPQQRKLLDIVPPHSLLQTPASVENTRRHNVPPFVYGNSIYYFYISDKASDGIFKQNFDVSNSDDSDVVSTTTNTPPIRFTDLVTVQSPAILNPNFRSSYGYKDKVYFFFSELDTSENSDVLFKTPTSFVAEICADDNGRRSYNSYGMARFLTFKKAAINCYLPDFTDKIHIKYNEIQQVTQPISMGENSSDIFYAIFNLRRANSIDSALCQYRVSSVESSMHGLFKFNPDKKPLQPYASCDDYKSLTSEEIDAYYRGINANNKYQMEQTVNSRALFALNSAKFTSLAVDASLGNGNHVIYVGLDNGRLLKIVNVRLSTTLGHTQPVIVSEYDVFASSSPVLNVMVAGERVVAVSSREIRSVRVDAGCARLSTCRQCVAAQDPYCVWSGASSKCVYYKQLVESRNEWNEQKCSDVDNDDDDHDDDSNESSLRTRTSSGVDKSYEMGGSGSGESSEPNLVYTINDYRLAKQLAQSSSNKNAGAAAARRSSTTTSSNNIAITILLVVLGALAASFMSMFLTCWFIKRYYDVRNKPLLSSGSGVGGGGSCVATGLLLEASNHHHAASSSSSSSSSYSSSFVNKRLQYLNPDRLVKFLNRYYFINNAANVDSSSSSSSSSQASPPLPPPPNVPPRNGKLDLSIKLAESRQKMRNCYEIATSAALKKDNLKPVTVNVTSTTTTTTRPNSSSNTSSSSGDSPYTHTIGSSSLEDSNCSNSPNNSHNNTNTNNTTTTTGNHSYLVPKYVSIGGGRPSVADTSLSSSDEMIAAATTATTTTTTTTMLPLARKFVNTDETTNAASSLLINKNQM